MDAAVDDEDAVDVVVDAEATAVADTLLAATEAVAMEANNSLAATTTKKKRSPFVCSFFFKTVRACFLTRTRRDSFCVFGTQEQLLECIQQFH